MCCHKGEEIITHLRTAVFSSSLMLGLASFATSALVATSPFAQAGDIAAGRTVMVKCLACHGEDGVSRLPYVPNLAGQKESYLILSLKTYKAGERQNIKMAAIAKSMSDEDMANVAAYYAAIKIIVEVPK